MKTTNWISQNSKKMAKGIAGIFVMKLLIIGSIFLIQSCQLEDDIDLSPQSISQNKFLSTIKQNSASLKAIPFKRKEILNKDRNNILSDDFQNVYVYSESTTDFDGNFSGTNQ